MHCGNVPVKNNVNYCFLFKKAKYAYSSCTLKPSLHSSLAPFCLAHLFAFAPLGLKETETSATQANSLEKSDVVIIYTSLKQ